MNDEKIRRLLEVLECRELISRDDRNYVNGDMSEAEWVNIPLEEGDDHNV